MAFLREADGVYVLDTGSTDGTPELLRGLGAAVYEQTITPWRFDIARNASLEMLPEDADVCICLDLDRSGSAPLARGAGGGLDARHYAGAVYLRLEPHARRRRRRGVLRRQDTRPARAIGWTHPVHEVLTADAPESCITIPELRVEHWPDEAQEPGGSISRCLSSPSPRIRMRRPQHALPRTGVYVPSNVGNAIETLMRHLAMPSARWDAERAASMRYIARCCEALAIGAARYSWLARAADEAPGQR